MTNDDIKQVLEGMTQIMRTVWNNPNLGISEDIADKYNISEEFRKNGKEVENETLC